jgi:hypothetical protein
MTLPVFSINAAAELLERDRRAVTTAMRHVPPDAKEKGQPRWRMATFVDALSKRPGAIKTASRNSHDDEATRIFEHGEAFARASDALVEIAKMPKRLRKAQAKHVFAKIQKVIELFERDEPDGLSEVPLSIVQQMTGGLMHACDIELDPSEFPDTDGD